MPKTLPEKFFIKSHYQIAVLNAPQYFLSDQFIPLPEGVTVSTTLAAAPYEVIIDFVRTAQELDGQLPCVSQAIKADSYVWFCYPKGGSKAKLSTDLNRDSLATLLMEAGLKPVHQISIDDTWSGLRFRANE